MKNKFNLISEGLTMQVEHRAILTEDWDICLCESKVTGRKVFAVLPSWMVLTEGANEMSLHHLLKCSAEIVSAHCQVLYTEQVHALMTGLLNNNLHDRFKRNLMKWHAIGLIQDAINGEVWNRKEELNYRTGVGKFS